MATEFTYFPLLLAELRIMIWNFCLPIRVVELEYDILRRWGHLDPYFWSSNKINSTPPGIMSVCHEARQIALEEGSYLYRDPNSESQVISTRSPRPSCGWVTPKTGILHLDWDFTADVFGYNHPDGRPTAFDLLVDLAKKFRAAAVRDMIIYPFGCEPDFQGLLHDNHLEKFDARKEWLVSLPQIPICAPKSVVIESGLFGRHGDEPIQLIDAFDHETIEKYYRLWLEASKTYKTSRSPFKEILLQDDFNKQVQRWSDNVKTYWVAGKYITDKALNKEVPEGLFVGSENQPVDFGQAADFRQPLGEDLPWVKEKLESMPVFRPMVMFRFCHLNWPDEGRRCYFLPSL